MNQIHLQLVTPERVVLKEQLESLSCPTQLGQITILPGHAALVAALVPGELVARSGHDVHYISVAGGFVEIRDSNQVVILADAAEHHYEIDIAKAEEAAKRARKAAAETDRSAEEYALVAANLQRSLSRLNVARKHSHRRAPITSEGVFEQ